MTRAGRCGRVLKVASLRLAEVAVAVSKVLSTANRYAAGLHRSVARILLFDMDEYHTRIPFKELPALRRASALGQIDGWMVKDWVKPEEWLYPLVQEALARGRRRISNGTWCTPSSANSGIPAAMTCVTASPLMACRSTSIPRTASWAANSSANTRST
jgi:hypothetical protein